MKQRVCAWLLLLYLVFVIYGSLVPFHFVPRPFDDAVAAFSRIPFLQLGIDSRADWVANLLLFIPLAFLAGMVFIAEATGGRLLRAGMIVVVGIALATGIEFVQLFFPGRTVSQNDILAESLGGVAGITFYFLWGGKAARAIDALWLVECRQGRVKRLLHAYLFVLLVFNVLPLDLTLSLAEMYHKWQSGRINLLPFGRLKGETSAAIYDVATDILVWIPVGLLWATDGTKPLRILWRSALLASGIEILQIFVYSRVTDITQVLLAAAGAAIGAGIAMMNKGRLPNPLALPTTTRSWLWWAWVFSVLAVFWFPYTFTSSGVSLDTVWQTASRVPFFTLYNTSEFHAINELLRKIAFFLPGGLLWGIRATAKSPEAKVSRGLLPLAAIALVVETGQLFLPGKVADLTDALIEFSGGALGLLAFQWLRKPGGSAMLAVPDTPAAKPSPAALWDAAPPPDNRWVHLLLPGLLSLAILLLVRLPGIPYNIRELVDPGWAGLFSAIGLALGAYWMANVPALMAIARRGAVPLRLPLLLVGHGLLEWFLLRTTVPMESIYDIVGSPVLGWAWEWEIMGRYLALHMVIALQILGGAICVSLLLRPSLLSDLLNWLILSLILSWPLHTLVVSNAGTDNLTELMRDGGSYATSSILACGFLLLCMGASALSASLAYGRRRTFLLVTAMVAIGLAGALLWAGSETTIVKYGKTFSAFQFLLSPDRDHYAGGVLLLARYAGVLAATSIGLAVLQLPGWLHSVKQWNRRPSA